MLHLTIGFSLGCLLVMALAVLKTHRQFQVSYIFIALMVATAGFLLHPVLPANWQWLTTDIQTTIPALFWLLCHFAFRERPSIIWPWLLLLVYSALVPALYLFSPGLGAYQPLMEVLFLDIPGYVEYLLIASGLWTVIQYWPDDLVASRRRLRVVVIVMVGAAVLVNVLSVNFGWGGALFQRLVVASCALVMAFQIMTVPQGLLFGITLGPPGEPTPPEPEPVNPELAPLLALMQQGFYKQEKLTLAQLAKTLNRPEYVVRSLINEQLGYRNFNDFVNEWRIEDATVQLVQAPNKPIMNISLDLGYRTLSSFNRAFKERTHKTPTQFRQDALNQAENCQTQ
ncbi:AraC family transcriptional regulator [Reinekea sp. G2M2-21]|uniref:helix-turn-helix domain-containing protein n=1 Tax=Reinekea sp. G2M2-21 TaxID=2788942 RepID=UPI0018A8B6F7|nr:helix-turn-helix transcriptional regulator [Reinekea sp. G2M2-21]